jgi:SseB protein N-terminal domain
VAHHDRPGYGPGLSLPELVFAPAHPETRQSKDLVFEVRELADGTRVLPVYSSTSRLVAALGPAQPWAALPLQATRELMAKAGVELIALDPEVAPSAPRWRPADLAELAESISGRAGEEPR